MDGYITPIAVLVDDTRRDDIPASISADATDNGDVWLSVDLPRTGLGIRVPRADAARFAAQILVALEVDTYPI